MHLSSCSTELLKPVAANVNKCLHAVGGAGMSLAFIAVYHALGFFPYSVHVLLPTVLSTSLVASAVESLPINQTLDDNFSVPAITALMGHYLVKAVQQSGVF